MKKRIVGAAMAAMSIGSLAAAEGWGEERLECGHVHAVAAALAAPKAFDAATGARADHFPTPRTMDIEHVRLDLTIADFSTRSMEASALIVFSAPWGDVEEVTLDAVGFEVATVERLEDGALSAIEAPAGTSFEALRGLDFFHDGKKLKIALKEPVKQGGRAAIRVTYTVREPESGLYWIEPVEGGVEPDWQVWSQGQAEENRYWFPTHDYPNERHTSELIAHVPAGNVVSAAGSLVQKAERADGLVTWHWRMDMPHVSYLTTFVAGNYHYETETWRGKAVDYYVPQRYSGTVKASFGKTTAMLDLFSELFEEEYPYPRYAQLIVDQYMHGGMENITASTLTHRTAQGPVADRYSRACGENSEGLIAHELGHQWFGDLMTCRTWAHTWLNEGWASYCEELWVEHACGRDTYDFELWSRRGRIAMADRAESRAPLAYLQLPSADNAFGFNGSAVYNKGAYVLHMLRMHLGDEAFFAGVAEYIDRHKYSTVITDDFRAALEAKSGRDLEAFFRQWCFTPGTPTFTIELDYNPATRLATVSMEQTQTIDEISPAFAGDFELWFRGDDGKEVRHTVAISEKKHRFNLAVESTPVAFAADPRGAFLSGRNYKVAAGVLRETALSGPTAFARLDAIRALENDESAATVSTLDSIVRDGSRFYGERREAISALSKIARKDARATVVALGQLAIEQTPDVMDYRLRTRLAEALRYTEREDAVPLLLQMIEDPSETVVAEAISSLSYFDDERVIEPIVEAARRRGEHDRILAEALGAIERRTITSAMDEVLRATKPDVDFRTRSAGARAVASLLERTEVEEGHPAAEELLVLTNDLQRGMKGAAIDALGRIKYRPAIVPLTQLAHADDDFADRANRAIQAILAEEGTPEEFRRLASRVEALEQKLKKAEEEKGGSRGGRGEAKAPEPPKKRKRFLGIF